MNAHLQLWDFINSHPMQHLETALFMWLLARAWRFILLHQFVTRNFVYKDFIKFVFRVLNARKILIYNS